MRLNRIPRVPHSCLKLNFVPTFVLTFVVFTYAILGSGGGVLLHSGEETRGYSVDDLGIRPL